jgi:alcohol dehydrogenase (cytochrome c)
MIARQHSRRSHTTNSRRVAGVLVRSVVLNSALLLLAVTALRAQVSFDRLMRADREPQNWLMYSGNTQGQRYSPLTQIAPANVRNLEQRWLFQAQSLEKFEATPLVADGVMYTVQAPNTVIALDAAVGRVFWTYNYTPSPQSRPCCGRVNRGLAILDDQLFMVTLDDHLIALDAVTGRLRWNTAVEGARPEAGYAMTVAPQIVKDKVITGVAGGEYGVRGFLAAFDVRSGKEVWRFNTVPRPGEPGHETWGGDSWQRGGAGVWTTGTYDPDLNLTYWGLGNPGPLGVGDSRVGDNLYSCSVVALDADTGRLRWHFQFTPHDEFDYDATQVPILADLSWQGRPRKVMLFANRNGYFYVLDRSTGEFLSGKPFVNVTWAAGLDAKGRPTGVRAPTLEGVRLEPGPMGGTNWYSPSYSPRTGLFYVVSWVNNPVTFRKAPTRSEFTEGRVFFDLILDGGGPDGPPGLGGGATRVNRRVSEDGHSEVRALDPRTGDRKWAFETTDFSEAGILTTASDLLFTGSREGYFYALDARTGSLLWHANVGGNVVAAPMSYAVDGRQYVAMTAGNGLFAYALRQ